MKKAINYLEFESWFIKLSHEAAVRNVSLNIQSVAEWKRLYDEGLDPKAALSLAV